VARTSPDTFAIGIDPATHALAYAARRVARTRLKNIALLVAAVEDVADGLASLADEVRVTFPWGALLRGAVAIDPLVLDALSRLPKPGGGLTLLVSLTSRDNAAALLEPTDVPRIQFAYAERELILVEARSLTIADVRASGSTWGKRLGAGKTRDGSYLRFIRPRGART
jgi:16S rRNA (adenine(1408)-N(1))-methyltransferase